MLFTILLWFRQWSPFKIVENDEFWKKKYGHSIDYFSNAYREKLRKKCNNIYKLDVFFKYRNQLLIESTLTSTSGRLSWKQLLLSGIVRHHYWYKLIFRIRQLDCWGRQKTNCFKCGTNSLTLKFLILDQHTIKLSGPQIWFKFCNIPVSVYYSCFPSMSFSRLVDNQIVQFINVHIKIQFFFKFAFRWFLQVNLNKIILIKDESWHTMLTILRASN